MRMFTWRIYPSSLRIRIMFYLTSTKRSDLNFHKSGTAIEPNMLDAAIQILVPKNIFFCASDEDVVYESNRAHSYRRRYDCSLERNSGFKLLHI